MFVCLFLFASHRGLVLTLTMKIQQTASQVIRPATYLNENHGSKLTPFLPSNKLPGPFRPIITFRNYTQNYQSNLNDLDDPNAIRYHPVHGLNAVLKESVPIALTNSPHISPEVWEINREIKVNTFLCMCVVCFFFVYYFNTITGKNAQTTHEDKEPHECREIDALLDRYIFWFIYRHIMFHQRNSQSSTMVLMIQYSKCMCCSRLWNRRLSDQNQRSNRIIYTTNTSNDSNKDPSHNNDTNNNGINHWEKLYQVRKHHRQKLGMKKWWNEMKGNKLCVHNFG